MTAIEKPQVEALVREYRAGELSRREFFQKLAFATGSILLAQQILLDYGFASEWEAYHWPEQEPAPAPKDSIAAGEKRLPATAQAEWVQYPSGEFAIGAYLARPKSGGPFPAIIVIHENRGLTEFVLDIAQRWTAEGLLAVAPDFLSRLGGTAGFDSMNSAMEGIRRLERGGVMEDLAATVRYLKSRGDVRGDRVGVSGFCWGGAQTFAFATEAAELAFALPFYGSAPPPERLANIRCPMFVVYAENDQRINANMEEVAARMAELGKDYAKKVYPGTGHAFMNFTGARYNAEQATAAWADVTAFVKRVIG